MSYERKHDWRGVIRKIDPEAEDRLGNYVSHVLVRESEIPRKYKELILMACSAAIRYGSSIRSHGTEAIKRGATDKEIIEALTLASMPAGFTVLVDGIEALGDLLGQPHEDATQSAKTPGA